MPISKDEQKKNYEEREKLKKQIAQEHSNINDVAMNVSSGSNSAKKDYWLGNTILKVIIFIHIGALVLFISCYIMLSVGVDVPFLP